MMIFDKFPYQSIVISVCVPCCISMLHKMMFAKFLILCAQCDFFCVSKRIKQIFSLNYSIIFELLHNPTFVEADDNDNDV